MPFPNIGPGELILILIIALIVLGPGRLPDVAASLGKSVREFRKAATDVSEAARIDAPAAQPATAQPATAQATPTATQAASPSPNTISATATPNELSMPSPAPEAVVPPVAPAASEAPRDSTAA